jgi:hypothetical protein
LCAHEERRTVGTTAQQTEGDGMKMERYRHLETGALLFIPEGRSLDDMGVYNDEWVNDD